MEAAGREVGERQITGYYTGSGQAWTLLFAYGIMLVFEKLVSLECT